jgi:glycosyltransferase involved in cell wall biosynthesis
MAMEKPVILGVEGESAELVMSAGGGICIEPESSKDLARQIVKLYRDPTLRQEFGSSGKRYVFEHFDRRALARRYADVIQRFCR